MSIKNSNDTIGNRTRDLAACSAVPQRTTPPAACPQSVFVSTKIISDRRFFNCFVGWLLGCSCISSNTVDDGTMTVTQLPALMAVSSLQRLESCTV